MVPFPEPLGPSIVMIGMSAVGVERSPEEACSSDALTLETFASDQLYVLARRACDPREVREGGRDIRDIRNADRCGGTQARNRERHRDAVIAVAIDIPTGEHRPFRPTLNANAVLQHLALHAHRFQPFRHHSDAIAYLDA